MPNVLTMPIEGQIFMGQDKPDQKPIEELVPYINDLLEDPIIEAVRWHQYTPYFNDGDACIFGVSEVYVKLIDGNPEGGEHEDGFVNTYDEDFKNRIGTVKYHWATKTYDISPGAVNPELAEAFTDFVINILSGTFDNALYKKYGDHAIVTVDKVQDKVIIEYFEHE